MTGQAEGARRATRRMVRVGVVTKNKMQKSVVVRVDRTDRETGGSGAVWIGTGSADAIYRFDPASGALSTYPVATRGATMRHLAIDPANGDLWVAYGASPAIHPTRIARLRLRR